MKAVQISEYGGPAVIKINEVDKPDAGVKQVVVEVHAASINPFDRAVREGYVQKMIPKLPVTIGGDIAGIITNIGKEVTDFDVGTQVYGTAIILGGASGGFAEFAAVGVDKIAKKPKNIDFTQAAALPLVGSSAIQALEEHMKLRPGQKILIHGGAGGIGSVAIQLAKYLGAYVATTVSEKDREFVKNLGADQVINYQNESFEKMLKNFDAVFDTVGGDVVTRSFAVLKNGGVIVSMRGQPDASLSKNYGVTAVGQNTQTNTVHLNRLRELVEAGRIKAQVGKVFPLEQTVEAFRYKEEMHPQGKVVIKIK